MAVSSGCHCSPTTHDFVRHFDGLELAILGVPDRHEPGAQFADALVVHRVAVIEVRVADELGHDRSLDQLHRVLAHPVLVVADVLHQRATQHDVEHLHATAQRQHRQVELQRRAGHRHVEFVVGSNDAVQRFLGRLLAVAARDRCRRRRAAARRRSAAAPCSALSVSSWIGGTSTGTPPARATARLYGWLLENASRLPSSLKVNTRAHTAISGGGWLMAVEL